MGPFINHGSTLAFKSRSLPDGGLRPHGQPHAAKQLGFGSFSTVRMPSWRFGFRLLGLELRV